MQALLIRRFVTKIKLSIVILSYNTKDLLVACLGSLEKVVKEVDFETIVVDNGSSDESVEAVKKLKIGKLRVVENKKNLGFAAGNNIAKNFCRGEYVLFLNSDTLIKESTLRETIKYMEQNLGVGAVTCKIILPSGKFDRDARRSFPTPWIAFTHFSGLDRIFPKSKLFARYWYGYISPNSEHEVDVLEGAFFLTRRKVLDEVGWFDETYFLDGEDIDLSWRIKEAGYKIIYYPKVSIIHIKKASKKKPVKENKKRFTMAGVNSMEIFYKKRLWQKYPIFINVLVLAAIKMLKIGRYFKLLLP